MRVTKDKNIHTVDISKPLNKKELLASVAADDCYTREWKPDDRLCVLCASNTICGILYNHRQNKRIKKMEKEEGGFLDSSDFDGIDREALIEWLKVEQRTTLQLIAHVQELSDCPDEKTVQYWCRSFILETKGIGTKEGKVIVKL